MSYVGNITSDGNKHLIASTLYGTCTTVASTATKVVTCPDFDQPIVGVTMHIKFTNTNTASNPKLNINNTGPKNIYRYGTTAPGITPSTSWQAGSVVSFTYDGSNWVMNDALDINTNTESILSEADRSKLDGIEKGANKYVHPSSGVQNGTYGTNNSSALTPAFGATFSVNGFTVDTNGHITSATSHTVKIPNTEASESTAGLMSSGDKTKLNGITPGANKYVHPTSGVNAGTYGTNNTTALTPNFGATFSVNGFIVTGEGHISSATTHTVKIPDTVASSSNAGLMSATDKKKLDGIIEGANKYTHPTSGVTAGTYGTNNSAALTPAFGATFSVDGITVDANGHITSASTHTVKIPNTEATETTAGLMSADDKKKLNKVPADGASNYVHPTSGVGAGTYGTNSTTALTPSFGSTFSVNGFVVDVNGHITSATTHTVKIPNATASQTAAGLMSADDKKKLDGLSNVGAYTHPTSGVTANTYGTNATTALTPAFGATFTVNGFAVNAEGHITSATSHTVKIPNNTATETAAGLMSADDKKKLNSLGTSSVSKGVLTIV